MATLAEVEQRLAALEALVHEHLRERPTAVPKPAAVVAESAPPAAVITTIGGVA